MAIITLEQNGSANVGFPNGTIAKPGIFFAARPGAGLSFTNGNTVSLDSDTGVVQINDGNSPVNFTSGVVNFEEKDLMTSTINSASYRIGSLSELLTLNTTGLTTDTVGNLLPANSIIDAVTCFIYTNITTTTNWAVGDANVSNRFSSPNGSLAAGTSSVGLNQVDQTGNSGPKQLAASKVRITCTGSNPGAGVIRITVFYRQMVAPNS